MSLIGERYFAAAPDGLLGDKLWTRFEDSQREHTPRAARWCAAYMHYYGDENEAGRTWGMTRRGEAGELASIRINRARRGSKARQQLIVSGRMAFGAKCKTDDVDAELSKIVAETWLEHDFQENGLEQLWKQWVEWSEVWADAYTFTEFDWTRGADLFNGSGIQRDGDVRTTLLPPWLVSSDNSVASPKDRNWWFVCLSRPKADLVHLYTKVRQGSNWVEGDEAERLIYDAKPFLMNNSLSWYGQRWDADRSLEDNAEVVTFIHQPTLALPLGRMVRLTAGDCVLEDRPLIGPNGDYDETAPCPIQRLAADEMAGTPHAWAPFFNVLATQELLDGMDTAMATTVTSFSNPLYAIDENANNKTEKLALGLRVWRRPLGGKSPELVQRPEIAESMLNYREILGEDMQQDFNVNNDATGTSDSKEKNAQAEALRASMAVQQVSSQAAESRAAARRMMEVRIKTLRKNANGERLLRIAGNSKRAQLATCRFFTQQNTAPLDNVTLEDANPLEDTWQGRQSMLDYLGPKGIGLIKTQEDVESVLTTGRLAKVIDPVRDENILIASENEAIQRGEAPMVYPTQNHVLHMRKHHGPTMTSAALKNPALLQTFDAHEREHWQMYFGCDRDTDPLYHPRMQFVKGLGPEPQAPIPPPAARGAPPAAPQPQPGAPGPHAPPPGHQPPPNGPPSTQGPSGPTQAAPVQPVAGQTTNLPRNPLTHQAFSPTAAPIQTGPPS